ncbi:MAG: hypothetical protein HY438_02815 [DPANN group archaeon]|nr:hypothetical protein [DPANN group archaeon]
MAVKLHIALTGSQFDLDAQIFDMLKERWIMFAKHNRLGSFANTDVFNTLHTIKTDIIQLHTIKDSLVQLQIKRQIGFTLDRVKEFAAQILNYRTQNNAHSIGVAHLNIATETIYLRTLLARLARA